MSLPERWPQIVMLCLLLVGFQQLASAGLIKAKASLAPLLIERAWTQSLSSNGTPVLPWPWADTWPVARLQVPASDIDLLVLAGDSGNALAFGPGHAIASASPGEQGTVVIGGHRDTHFAFLRDLKPTATLQLQNAQGITRTYRIQDIAVIDASEQQWSVAETHDTLLLVTCYPFDALLAGGPLRYVVSAVPAPSHPGPESLPGALSAATITQVSQRLNP